MSADAEQVTCKVCGARVNAEMGRYAARLMWSHRTSAGERCTALPQDCVTDGERAAREKREAQRSARPSSAPGTGIDWAAVRAKAGKPRSDG